ncbi:32886_t:CDS:1, partial [Racocetra persica]
FTDDEVYNQNNEGFKIINNEADKVNENNETDKVNENNEADK